MQGNPYDYPKEYFIPLVDKEGELQYLEGRLILNHLKNHYSVEVDIVQRESHKIYTHLGLLTDFTTETEAIEAGIHFLKKSISRP